MEIIKPWVELNKIDGIKIMKNVELAAKQCYRTQGNITDTSYKHFLKNCINRGHESVLEHEKITIHMCCDIGVYKDLTRHRHASFSIESTRYCNYSNDRFGNEIKFIEPVFYVNSWLNAIVENREETIDERKSDVWTRCMNEIEDIYKSMSNLGCTPDELRMVLPHSTAAELYMTANIREWRHILKLRAVKESHPAIQQLMIPLLKYFQETMPELFGEIEYNKDFDENKYANLIIKE